MCVLHAAYPAQLLEMLLLTRVLFATIRAFKPNNILAEVKPRLGQLTFALTLTQTLTLTLTPLIYTSRTLTITMPTEVKLMQGQV